MYNLKSIQIQDFLSIKDITYNFNQTEPYIIVGQNLDNSGQTGNGSGKSSFIEAIAFAITGLTLRDVLIKKLIRRGHKTSKVILNLTSTTNNLTIERLIDSKASKQTTIFNNQIEESKNLPDENSKNQWILNEIGITKDDFFQFYLVTRERYKPFFLSSDNEKKTIINRFSGADVVDNIFPFLDKDSGSLSEKIISFQYEYNKCGMQVDVWNEQIDQLYTENDNTTKIDIDIASIQRHKNSIDSNNEMIKSSNIEIKQLKNDLEDLNDNKFIDLIKQSEQEKETHRLNLSALKSQIKQVSDKYQLEINKCDGRLHLIDQESKQVYKSKNEVIDIYHDTKNKLNAAIECPKCHHNFVIDDDFDIEEGKKMIEDCELLISDFDNQIEDFKLKNNSILENKTKYRNLIQQEELAIQKQADEITILINTCDKIINVLTQQKNNNLNQIQITENKIKRIEYNIESYEQSKERSNLEIIGLEDEIKVLREGKIDQSKIDAIKLKIDNQNEYIKTIADEIEKMEGSKGVLDEWYVNFKNFKSNLANQSIDNIQQYTNLYLQQMNSDLTIKIEGYKEQGKKIKEQIDVIVQREGFDIGSYGEFSGGERCRIDFANILAMQTLINLNSSNGLNFILVDEILEPLDVIGIESIILALKTKNKPLMVVSQQEINSLPKNTLTMVKHKGITTIK